jgi:AcrR family transcriptional regulator
VNSPDLRSNTIDKQQPQTQAGKRRYAGLSEEERVQQRLQRFLAAGLEVFAEHGLRGASVRTLCRQAGLTERYFYAAFADTEALFCAVYEQQSQALQDHFVAAITDLQPELGLKTRIQTLLDQYFSLMQDEKLVRILLLESRVGSQRVIDMHHDNIRRYSALAAAWMHQDYPDMKHSDTLITGVAVAVIGACTSLVIDWMLDGYRLPREQVVDSATLVLLGIMRELTGENLEPA